MQSSVKRIALFVLPVLCWVVCSHHALAQWPRFLGKNFNGSVDELAVEPDWSEPPQLRWSLPVGEGYGLGAIASGVYYHQDALRPKIRGGPFQERIRAINIANGETIWQQSSAVQYSDLLGYEDGPRSTPSVGQDGLYTFGVTGLLTKRSIADGKKIWSVDTSKRYSVVQNFFGIGASPLLIDDLVVVMVGGSPAEDQKIAPMQLDRVSASGSALVAFDRKSGNEVWRCGDDLASYSSPRSIELDGKPFVLAFVRSGLILADAKTGEVAWRFDHRAAKLESVNAMVPVVSGNLVFISECYEVGSVLLKCDAATRTVIWQDPPRDRRNQAMRSHWATPVLVDGNLFGCSGRNAPDSDFRCIDLSTGAVKWKDDRRTRTSTTLVGERLLVLEERGKLQVIAANPQRLEILAQWDLSDPADMARMGADQITLRFPCWAAPIVSDGCMLVRGDTQVLCLDLPRSKPPR